LQYEKCLFRAIFKEKNTQTLGFRKEALWPTYQGGFRKEALWPSQGGSEKKPCGEAVKALAVVLKNIDKSAE